MNKFFLPMALVLSSTALLSACGGATTTATNSFATLTSTTAGSSTVTAVTLDSGTPTTSSQSGSFAHASSTATLGGSGITLDASSALSNDQAGDRYSYVAGLNTSTDFKVVAIATDASDLPSNQTVTYNGQALVTVTDVAATYEGTMESTVTANFGSTGSDVNVVLNSITNATQTTGAAAPTTYTATNSENITFSDLTISGNGFASDTGSSASITGFGAGGGTFNATNTEISATGVFAGPTADEVAGAGTISTTGATALVTFSGTQ